jgi:glycerol kinase
MMRMKQYILALDQGTTSSRAIVFNEAGAICGLGQKEFRQIFPSPGWVEHDPYEILESQLYACRIALEKSKIKQTEVAALGIANQRETTLMWERATGKPVANAIVWQCRRTSEICRNLKKAGLEDEIRSRTGLVIDPYFSGTKIMWLFENVAGLRKRAEAGEILFGTVDSWLLYNLTGVHATDPSNASRTILFNIHSGTWDEEILRELKIPSAILPRVLPSSGEFGTTNKITGKPVPVCGVAGDQQAALFGQGCLQKGAAKNTYGTGCFLLMNTGKEAVQSKNNLLSTVAWDIGGGLEYALEGSVFIAGAALQWLRDQLGIIDNVAETAALAASVKDTGGVYFVPAFVGLGAPYWNPEARGTIVGLTRGTTRAHIVRAALESIAYQTKDLLVAMEKDTGCKTANLKADGGASLNDFLMQFQADILGLPVTRPAINETTALGAALLAGLAAGVWVNMDEIGRKKKTDTTFLPAMNEAEADDKYRLWAKAVRAALAS